MTSHERDQQTAAQQTYEVLLVKDTDEPSYAVICPALGCASQGDTTDEAIEMIAEVVSLHLDDLDEQGQPAPADVVDLEDEIAEYTSAGATVTRARVSRIDWNVLIAECEATLRENSLNDLALIKRAEIYLNTGDNIRAIADYNRVIALNILLDHPQASVVEAYCCRGHAYSNTGDYNQAIADYDRALRKDPYHFSAITGMEGAYIALWQSRQTN